MLVFVSYTFRERHMKRLSTLALAITTGIFFCSTAFAAGKFKTVGLNEEKLQELKEEHSGENNKIESALYRYYQDYINRVEGDDGYSKDETSKLLVRSFRGVDFKDGLYDFTASLVPAIDMAMDSDLYDYDQVNNEILRACEGAFNIFATYSNDGPKNQKEYEFYLQRACDLSVVNISIVTAAIDAITAMGAANSTSH